MVGNGEAFGTGDGVLALFNLGVKKLFHFAAVQADQVVVVLALIELIHRFAALKMATAQNAGLLKLRQHTVHRGQSDVGAVFQQHAENVLSRHVALRAFLEDFQYFQAWQCGFEPSAFEFVNVVHGCFSCANVAPIPCECGPTSSSRAREPNRYNGLIISLPMGPAPILLSMLQFIPNLRRPGIRSILMAAGCAALVACGGLNSASSRVAGIVTPYKMDIVQGNFVSKEQAAALQPGMSRPQVRDLLGSPLLVSMFHADRWDYVFTFKRQGFEPQARQVTVFFKGDVLERFEAGELPTEAEFVASLDSGRKSGKVPVLEASEENLAKFAPAAKAPEPKALPPLRESYPPLEPATR